MSADRTAQIAADQRSSVQPSAVIRVLHIADKFGVDGSTIHGVSRLFTWWFPRVDRARYDLQLIGLRSEDGASEELRRHGVEVMTLGKSKFDPSTLITLVRLIRRMRPDVLHLHGYGAANFGRVAARLTGRKVIMHEHFVDPRIPWYQRLCDRALAGWTDRAIAVCESVGQFMVRQRRVPPDRLSVILYGAPLDRFQPVRDAAVIAQERRRWSIPDGWSVVTAVGRLGEQKGFGYLLDAAALMRRRGRRLKVVLVGDGPLRETLAAQARRCGIEADVIFAGYQADVRPIQAMSDAHALPSLWEGVPLAAFEAMAMARTIVSTPVDGLKEILRDGENALLVPPRDPEALAQALERVLADRPLAQRLAAQALADSRQLDIQRMVERIQAVYDELAAEARR